MKVVNRVVIVWMLGSVGLGGACHRASGVSLPGFELEASAFDPARVGLATYAYEPVGLYAVTRSAEVPFVDANGNGRFDPNEEASGRCDPQSRRCRLEDHRLRVVMRTTDCPGTTGTWIVGSAYDRAGARIAATLCTADGRCAEPHRDAFQGLAVDAIWLPVDAAPTSHQRLALTTAARTYAYDDVELPHALHLSALHTEDRGDLRISVTADQSVDLVSLSVLRGDAVAWSGRGAHADGATLDAVVPREVLDACAGDCEGYLQIAHVWRDDDVLAMGEIKQRVF
jgi:hypothetical protein